MNLRTLSAALLAVAASAVWMAAGTASAATLTSGGLLEPPNAVYTGSIVAEAEGHAVLDNPISTINCASKVEGEVESHGEGVPAAGEVSSLSFTGCTNSWHVTVVSGGSLEIHETESGSGTVTSNGATVEATRFGITCRYATSNTSIGNFTGSYTTGTNATLDIEASIPFHSGSGLCGSSATAWTGSYVILTPTLLELQKKVPPGPKLELKTTIKKEFDEGKSKVFDVWDKSSPVAYTLEKTLIASEPGAAYGNEGGTCTNIAVEKEKPEKKICESKFKCITKGDGVIQAYVNVGGAKEFVPFSVKCV